MIWYNPGNDIKLNAHTDIHKVKGFYNTKNPIDMAHTSLTIPSNISK